MLEIVLTPKNLGAPQIGALGCLFNLVVNAPMPASLLTMRSDSQCCELSNLVLNIWLPLRHNGMGNQHSQCMGYASATELSYRATMNGVLLQVQPVPD